MDVKKMLTYTFLFLTFAAASQTRDTSFIRVYSGSGYDYSRDIIQTADSNFVITGSSSSFPSSNADVLLMKVGHYGDLIWSDAYGGSGDDWGTKVSELADSSLVISGYTNSFGQGGFDFYLLKTDSSGTLEWSKTFGGFNWDLCHSHVVCEDKDILLVGETQSFGSGKKDIMVVRTDSMGVEKWRRYYGGAEDDIAYDVVRDTTDSTFFIAGMTESYGNQKQGYLLKLNDNGDTLFTKIVGGPLDDQFNAAKFNESQTGLVAVGYKSASVSDKDFWFYTMGKSNGNEQLNMTDGGDQVEIAYDFDIGSFSDIMYGGTTTSFGYAQFDGKEDIWLGNRLFNGGWVPYFGNFGESGVDDIRSVKWLLQQGIAAVGNTSFYSDSENGIILIRIDLLANPPQLNNSQNEDINSSTDDYILQNNFQIYPNPFDNQITIELKELSSNTQLGIFTMDGKLIKKIHLNTYSNTISTENWERGFYVLQFSVGGNYAGSFKLMK